MSPGIDPCHGVCFSTLSRGRFVPLFIPMLPCHSFSPTSYRLVPRSRQVSGASAAMCAPPRMGLTWTVRTHTTPPTLCSPRTAKCPRKVISASFPPTTASKSLGLQVRYKRTTNSLILQWMYLRSIKSVIKTCMLLPHSWFIDGPSVISPLEVTIVISMLLSRANTEHNEDGEERERSLSSLSADVRVSQPSKSHDF